MSSYVSTRPIHWERQPRPATIGLALGGGAGRGVAHIGVLQVLEENQIFPTSIAGTSVGSLVGGLYAAGVSPSRLQVLAEQLKWRNLASVNIPSLNLSSLSNLSFGEGSLPFLDKATGLFELDKMEGWIDQILGGSFSFEQLNLPFVAVATDLATGEAMALNTGPIAPAIRASSSVPGVFTPSIRDGRMLVDGAVSNNLPVSVVRAMGADYVIAVDLLPTGGTAIFRSTSEQPYTPRHVVDIIVHALFDLVRLTQHEMTPPNCFISPSIGHISLTDLSSHVQLIERGRAATEEQIPQILRDLGRG